MRTVFHIWWHCKFIVLLIHKIVRIYNLHLFNISSHQLVFFHNFVLFSFLLFRTLKETSGVQPYIFVRKMITRLQRFLNRWNLSSPYMIRPVSYNINILFSFTLHTDFHNLFSLLRWGTLRGQFVELFYRILIFYPVSSLPLECDPTDSRIGCQMLDQGNLRKRSIYDSHIRACVCIRTHICTHTNANIYTRVCARRRLSSTRF